MALAFAPDELIVDNFAGGGGASTGIEAALGRSIDIAINHDPQALAMHQMNHPNTVHLCEDVWAVDVKKVVAGRKVGLAWFSPDCKHFSVAKGGKPVEKKIRGLAWVALKWAKLARPRVIFLENVQEFATWGPVVDGRPCPRRKGKTFKSWCRQLRALGYEVEFKILKACDYGAPTIRKRLFLVARCDGQPIVWPKATHGEDKIPYRTAAECIDWSLPCPSIFLTKEEGREIGVNRPLAEATMRRIARGIQRYVINAANPFIVSLTHQGGDRCESIDDPFKTVTGAKRGEKALVVPYLAGVGGRAGCSPERPVGKPFQTVTAKADAVLVVPHITTYYGAKREGDARGASVEDPLATQPTENRHALVSAILVGAGGSEYAGKPRSVDTPWLTQKTDNHAALVSAFLAKHFGGHETPGAPVEEPASTITAKDHHALVTAHICRQFGASIGSAADEPAGTTTAGGGGKSALVTSHLVKLRGTCRDGQPVDEPAATISAQGTHIGEVRAFLMKYFGTDQDPRLEEPLHTVTSKDRFALVTVEGQQYQIVDIGMRMLTPRELFRAQGFPESYIIDKGLKVTGEGDTRLLFPEEIKLTKTAQVRMCGNSVSPSPAEALVRAQFSGRTKRAAA